MSFPKTRHTSTPLDPKRGFSDISSPNDGMPEATQFQLQVAPADDCLCRDSIQVSSHQSVSFTADEAPSVIKETDESNFDEKDSAIKSPASPNTPSQFAKKPAPTTFKLKRQPARSIQKSSQVVSEVTSQVSSSSVTSELSSSRNIHLKLLDQKPRKSTAVNMSRNRGFSFLKPTGSSQNKKKKLSMQHVTQTMTSNPKSHTSSVLSDETCDIDTLDLLKEIKKHKYIDEAQGQMLEKQRQATRMSRSLIPYVQKIQKEAEEQPKSSIDSARTVVKQGDANREEQLKLRKNYKNFDEEFRLQLQEEVSKSKKSLIQRKYLRKIFAIASSKRSQAMDDEVNFTIREIEFFKVRKFYLRHGDTKLFAHYFQFQHTHEFQFAQRYSEVGKKLYYIIKGVVSLQEPNPEVDDWLDKKKRHEFLEEWKKTSFLPRADKAKIKFQKEKKMEKIRQLTLKRIVEEQRKSVKRRSIYHLTSAFELESKHSREQAGLSPIRDNITKSGHLPHGFDPESFQAGRRVSLMKEPPKRKQSELQKTLLSEPSKNQMRRASRRNSISENISRAINASEILQKLSENKKSITTTEKVLPEIEEYSKYMKLTQIEKDRLEELHRLSKIQWFVEVERLASGQTFGGFETYDNLKENQAVMTLCDCFLMTLAERDYNRVNKRIALDKYEEKINFFKRLPCLKFVGQMVLQKLMQLFVEERFMRNQTVIHQGDSALKVYIVGEGDFEVVRTKQNRVTNKEMAFKTVRILNEAKKTNSQGGRTRVDPIAQIKKLDNRLPPSFIKLATVSKGFMIGQEDVINGRKYSTTIRCLTNNGMLYSIKREEFISKMQKDDRIWDVILEASFEKDENTKARIIEATEKKKTIVGFYKKIKVREHWGDKHNVNLQKMGMDDLRATFKQIVKVSQNQSEPVTSEEESQSSEEGSPLGHKSPKSKKLNTLTFSIEDEQKILAQAEKHLGSKFDKKAVLSNPIALSFLRDEVGIVEQKLIEQANNKIAKFIQSYEDQQLPSTLKKKWLKFLRQQQQQSPPLSKQNTLKRKDLFRTNEKLDEQTYKTMQMKQVKQDISKQKTMTSQFGGSPEVSVQASLSIRAKKSVIEEPESRLLRQGTTQKTVQGTPGSHIMDTMNNFFKQTMAQRQSTIGGSPEISRASLNSKLLGKIQKMKSELDGTSSTRDYPTTEQAGPYSKRLGKIRVTSIKEKSDQSDIASQPPSESSHSLSVSIVSTNRQMIKKDLFIRTANPTPRGLGGSSVPASPTANPTPRGLGSSSIPVSPNKSIPKLNPSLKIMRRRVVKQPPTFANSHQQVKDLKSFNIDNIIFKAQNPIKCKRMGVAKTIKNSQEGSEVFSSRNMATGATTAVDWRAMRTKINQGTFMSARVSKNLQGTPVSRSIATSSQFKDKSMHRHPELNMNFKSFDFQSQRNHALSPQSGGTGMFSPIMNQSFDLDMLKVKDPFMDPRSMSQIDGNLLSSFSSGDGTPHKQAKRSQFYNSRAPCAQLQQPDFTKNDTVIESSQSQTFD